MEAGLEPDPSERAAHTAAVVAFVDEFLSGLRDAPAWSVAELDAVALRTPPPSAPRSIEAVLSDLGTAIDSGFDTASGRFLSFIPSGGLHAAALGAYLGAATNEYTGASHASPGSVALEQGVIDWLMSLFGLPDSGAGVLTSGGSIANLIAMVAARHRLGEDFADGVVYVSALAHHSIEKAARIAGIRTARIRTVPVDARHRLDADALSEMVDSDVAEGFRPLMIAATAGTTDVGSVDPISACADLAHRTGAWFHVDAAYGGFFQLTERGRLAFGDIDRADSITIDAHKSLFLPFGIGCVLVRDLASLVDAHEGEGAYMQDLHDTGLPHYYSMGPELTRPNRGLAVWLALHLHGVDAFRAELDRMLDLAEFAASSLDAIPRVELACSPELSIVAFRSSAGDDATRALFDAVNRSGAANVSSTTIEGRTFVRLAFLSQRTTRAVLDDVLDVVATASAG